MTAPLLVVVGRIGRAHGVRGDVGVEVRTDEPERRFAPGLGPGTDPACARPHVVTVERWRGGTAVDCWCTFDEVDDRTAAEALRGVLPAGRRRPGRATRRPRGVLRPPAGRARRGTTSTGRRSARWSRSSTCRPRTCWSIEHAATARRERSLVPFVPAIVPEVDLAAGRLVVDLPAGLLDLPAE